MDLFLFSKYNKPPPPLPDSALKHVDVRYRLTSCKRGLVAPPDRVGRPQQAEAASQTESTGQSPPYSLNNFPLCTHPTSFLLLLLHVLLLLLLPFLLLYRLLVPLLYLQPLAPPTLLPIILLFLILYLLLLLLFVSSPSQPLPSPPPPPGEPYFPVALGKLGSYSCFF
jgi:hypothetical protein